MATLTDSRDAVYDVKFAPRHCGLKVAACSGDGYMRIYEAIDVMNLSSWSLQHEFEIAKGSNKNKSIPCFSWNMNPYDPLSLVAATSGERAAKVILLDTTPYMLN